MPPADALREGERIFAICNACRYCEGYCAVFPAMERRARFTPADLHYLANLCHQCGECYYACQYAPPHEFAVNVPRTLTQIRVATYRQYAWPAHRSLAFVLVLAAGLTAALLWPGDVTPGAFYRVISYHAMVSVFGFLALFIATALAVSFVTFYGSVAHASACSRGLQPAVPNPRALLQAARDALTLKYLSSGGPGCPYPAERHSQRRRYFHHATFYGFLFCFASTATAAFYHHVLHIEAPYNFLSLPVALGTLGGLALLAGTTGLYWLQRRQEPATSASAMRGLDQTLLALLFLTSLTGLFLLAFRATSAMAALLYLHLGAVLALFAAMPYGKFAHGFYRLAALIRYAVERSSRPGARGQT